jgi:thiamine-phosphate pyrophosphorylase
LRRAVVLCFLLLAPLATAGADFVAVGAFMFDDPRGLAAALKDAALLLALPETVE